MHMEFMSKPAFQHHLYEIHTAPQAELISAVLSVDQVVELARLAIFLKDAKTRMSRYGADLVVSDWLLRRVYFATF